MKKDKIITIRVSEKEKKKLIEKSKIAKLSLLEYLIEQGLDKEIVIVDGLNEVVVELRRIGNNINQIAHVGNTQKFVYKAQLNDVMKHLQEIEELQRKILIAMFSDEEHTLITLEKKIERLTKSVDSIGGRITN